MKKNKIKKTFKNLKTPLKIEKEKYKKYYKNENSSKTPEKLLKPPYIMVNLFITPDFRADFGHNAKFGYNNQTQKTLKSSQFSTRNAPNWALIRPC